MAETGNNNMPWYAVRLFGCRALRAKAFFEEKGIECFVPMNYCEKEDTLGRKQQRLVPVVNNLVFIRKQMTDIELQTMIQESGMKMAVMTRTRGKTDYYEIPAIQMNEFQIMCNPDVHLRQFISPEEAQLKLGSQVMVSHGPLKGLTGKLVRQSHKYYLLKEVPGMAVMLKVTRWCCKPVHQ